MSTVLTRTHVLTPASGSAAGQLLIKPPLKVEEGKTCRFEFIPEFAKKVFKF
jgi:hypothetical protein